MANQSKKALLQKRDALVKKLLKYGPTILRGSLIERYKRCGKAGCKCAKGKGHGPKYYLSVSQPGRHPEMDYIPLNYQELTSKFIENHHSVKDILEKICDINRELIKKRETF